VKCWPVALLVVCAGCKFSVDAITDNPASDDLAIAAAGDLATSLTLDLGLADLTVLPPADLRPDPCAGAPPLGVNNVAAQCVIGKPPTIDGDLSDWPLTQFLPMTKTTSAQANGSWDTAVANDTNSSAKYFVRWDLTYLYVAIAIADDIRETPNSGPQISNNDAIEIFVDGNHTRSTTYGADDWQLVYSADQTKVASQGMVVSWPAGTHEAWGGTSPAFTVEAAIPWSILGSIAVTPGRIVGFDLKLDDNDGDNSDGTRERDLILYYNPGNGGGNCSAPNCRTDAFGAVQLQGR
jgi:hypothetical protein